MRNKLALLVFCCVSAWAVVMVLKRVKWQTTWGRVTDEQWAQAREHLEAFFFPPLDGVQVVADVQAFLDDLRA